MLRFSDSGKHPLQTVRSEKFGKGALSKILRSQLQLRWGGHSLSFRPTSLCRAPLQETERTPWACSDAFFYPCCWSNIAIELDYGLPRRCGKALRALSATRSVVRQCEAGVLDWVASTRDVVY